MSDTEGGGKTEGRGDTGGESARVAELWRLLIKDRRRRDEDVAVERVARESKREARSR